MRPSVEARPGDLWKRLLWREYREGRAAVLLALVLPALMFYLGHDSGMEKWQGAFRFVGALSAHLLVLFWAISRGDSQRGHGDFAFVHLPIRPVRGLTASFIVPALASAVIGAAYGALISLDAGSVIAGTLDVMTTFVFGYYFAAIASRWLAVLVGVVSIIWAKLIPITSLTPTRDLDATIITISCAIGAGLGLYVFSILIGRKPLAYRQLAALGVMAVFGLGPALVRFDPGIFRPTQSAGTRPSGYPTSLVGYSDQHVLVSFAWAGKSEDILVEFQHVNSRRPEAAVSMSGSLKVIDVLHNRYVYIVQQHKGSSTIQIIEWDTAEADPAQSTTPVARFTARPEAIPDDYHPRYDSVSRDRAYALVVLEPIARHGYDLWVVYLKTGRAAVVSPATSRLGLSWLSGRKHVVWTRNYALVVSIPDTRPTVVDLKTLAVVPLKFPLVTGGAR